MKLLLESMVATNRLINKYNICKIRLVSNATCELVLLFLVSTCSYCIYKANKTMVKFNWLLDSWAPGVLSCSSSNTDNQQKLKLACNSSTRGVVHNDHPMFVGPSIHRSQLIFGCETTY